MSEDRFCLQNESVRSVSACRVNNLIATGAGDDAIRIFKLSMELLAQEVRWSFSVLVPGFLRSHVCVAVICVGFPFARGLHAGFNDASLCGDVWPPGAGWEGPF